jgi:hypothetical protein
VRFSLKWILAATVYVAIAAAAFGRGTWYYADGLWALTLLAVVYAIAVAAFASGKRRAMAATFVVGCACFLLCVTFGSDAVPTARLLVASGLGQTEQPAFNPPQPQPSISPAPAAVWNNGYYAPTVQLALPSPPSAPSATVVAVSPAYRSAPSVDLSVYLRAANAVATLAFGLMGSLVGLMAFRASAKGDGRE